MTFSKKNSKHTKEPEPKKLNKVKVTIFVILLIAIVAVSSVAVYKVKNKDGNEQNSLAVENVSEENNTDNNTAVNEEDEEITMIEDDPNNTVANDNPAYEEDFPDQIGGYKVVGQVVIDKIGVKRSILDKTTNKALKLAPTWFDGPSANKIGNMTITGHNNSSQFKRLPELNVGDTFYVIDKATLTKVTYKIYDIFTVYPEDTDYVLSQKTNGKMEVTLVTCNPGGLTRRIFKAREV